MKLKIVLFIFLLFLFSISLIIQVRAEEKNVTIGFVFNVPGQSIFIYLASSNLYQNFGEVNMDEHTITLKKELSKEEIEDLANGLSQYKNNIKNTFNLLNSLLREKQLRNAETIEQIQTNENGKIESGVMRFQEGYVGDIIAKVGIGDIQVYNAIINFSEDKIYLGIEGYFQVFDPKTRAIYYYKLY